MIDYSWVPWFRELACKIAEGGEAVLVENARAVDRQVDDPPTLRYGNDNVDPFSFFYSLSSQLGADRLMRLLDSVHDVFALETARPEHPHILRERPNLLWRLFRQASREDPDIRSEDFDAALQIRSVAIEKLTQTLFIINPDHFLPADHTSEALPRSEFKQRPRNHKEYVALVDAIKALFPGCAPYEINTFLDTQVKEQLIGPRTRFFQVSTNVYDQDEDHWTEFESANAVWTGAGEAPAGTSYGLENVTRGDVILVRRGFSGRAIGVVDENGYADAGWTCEARISVYWINKCDARLANNTNQYGFWSAEKGMRTYEAFSKTAEYADTLALIDKIVAQCEATVEVAETREMHSAINKILFGPPGTGKTFDAVSEAVQVIDGSSPDDREGVKARFNELRQAGQIEFVTFHQNYAYEDFIEGIRPVLNRNELTYELRNGIFKEIAKRAGEYSNDRYVLIIDEINRGNIAKIFGELITLIEPSKRLGGDDAAVARLPYSQELFGVPSNLNLIGTMNTADRGILLLDTALRRRFEFDPRMPDVSLVAEDIDGVNGQRLLTAINERIVKNRDRDHQIGHTYLMGIDTLDALAHAFQRQIVPLLQEYFYDDWEKMHRVLNDNAFIKKGGGADQPVFDMLPRDDDKWLQPDSYRAIYGSYSGVSDDS